MGNTSYRKKDYGGTGRKWVFEYIISDRCEFGCMIIRHCKFRAADAAEAKRKILAILKRAIASTKDVGRKTICDMALPSEPAAGQNAVFAEEMIRLKDRYGNRRLLRIKDPEKVLVQGYGPKTLEELRR
jgi:hypothetical protein